MLKIESAVSSLVLGALSLVATGLLTSPAFGGDLPLNTSLSIRNEANNRWLTPNPTNPSVVKSFLGVELNILLFSGDQSWQFLPSGRPGQVVISHRNTGFILDADPAPNDTDPSPIKVAPATSTPTPSQLWRIIETNPGTGPYLIEHVQTGRLLDADAATLNSTNNRTNLQMLGRDDDPIQANRQWRFYPTQAQFTPVQALSPRIELPPGAPDFTGKKPRMDVTVTLQGSGTDRLTAVVSMVLAAPASGGAAGPAISLPPVSFPIMLDGTTGQTVLPGKKILLNRALGSTFLLTQSLSYTDPDSFEDILRGSVFAPAGNNRVAFRNAVGQAISTATGAPLLPWPPPNDGNNIIWFCPAFGEPRATPPTKPGVLVLLEQQAITVEVP